MKTPIYILLSLMLVGLTSIGSVFYDNQQSSDQFFKKIELAIARNDAQQLYSMFNSSVEISVNSKEGAYNKEQAMQVTREFFMNYPVKSFRLLHNGNSGENYYAVGEYQSQRGKFDVNILIRKAGDQHVIDHIRFEQGQ